MIKIFIEDPENFNEINEWAKTLESFKSAKLIDVSDVSYKVDEVGIFKFKKPSDAILFKLRWKIQ